MEKLRALFELLWLLLALRGPHGDLMPPLYILFPCGWKSKHRSNGTTLPGFKIFILVSVMLIPQIV